MQGDKIVNNVINSVDIDVNSPSNNNIVCDTVVANNATTDLIDTLLQN